jgi:hypothetical protein
MHAKSIVAVVMLLFVGTSVAILVRREMRESGAGPAAVATEQLPDNALVVYYFHGQTRCPTCRKIESYSHDAVHTAFVDELAQKKVVWRVVNYEQPENAHFVTDYKLLSSSIVLVHTTDGKVTEWRNLERVWDLVGNPDTFTEYIRGEARSMLGS